MDPRLLIGKKRKTYLAWRKFIKDQFTEYLAWWKFNRINWLYLKRMEVKQR
jgi:hypothetical protein